MSKMVFSGDLGVKDRPILRDPYNNQESRLSSLWRLHTATGSIRKIHMDVKNLMDIIRENHAKRGGTYRYPFLCGRQDAGADI